MFELRQDEAMEVGLRALHERDGRIPEALYQVYSHFRLVYLDEAGLMDVAPDPTDEAFVEALQAARDLERYVGEHWASAILVAFDQ